MDRSMMCLPEHPASVPASPADVSATQATPNSWERVNVPVGPNTVNKIFVGGLAAMRDDLLLSFAMKKITTVTEKSITLRIVVVSRGPKDLVMKAHPNRMV